MTDPTMNAAELDTLPVGAVVLSRSGVAYQRLPYSGYWAAVRSLTAWPSSLLDAAEPFTLLHPLDEAKRPLSTTERTEP